MRLASRLVPPPHAAHPPRRLHPALRSRCAPCSRSFLYDCAKKDYNVYSRGGAGKVYRMKSTSKKRSPSIVNLTVKRRYLTEREVERLMDCVRKHGRYGHRDATMILVAYRHGLRASEEAAKMPFPIHPHMLRHACGFKLANDGHDTRALQHYLGHKNIQHTVRYTEMAPDRFKDFWRD